MEMASIGFLGGTIFCLLGVLVGRLSGDRDNQGQSNDVSGIRSNVSDRNRSRSGNIGCFEQMDPEEVICGLETIDMSLSGKEKEFLRYALESVRIRNRLERYIEENENNRTPKNEEILSYRSRFSDICQ